MSKLIRRWGWFVAGALVVGLGVLPLAWWESLIVMLGALTMAQGAIKIDRDTRI